MRIPRVFQNRPLDFPLQFYLDEAAANHLITVLRLDVHNQIILFNGDGNEYPAIITHINRKSVEVNIKNKIEKNRESPLKIHLGQAIAKGERMDLIVQKATELGVTEITPLFSTRSEVRLKGEREQKKLNHWHKVIQSACEQSGRNHMPALYSPVQIHEWINNVSDTVGHIKIMLDTQAQHSLNRDLLKQSKTIYLLIGPEGGLSVEEKLFAEKNNFSGILLGPRILRTETASLAALSVLQYLAGDFCQ